MKRGQLELFSRDCPGCEGTGWRTIRQARPVSQSGHGRGLYELLFACSARTLTGEPINEKTWKWVEDVFNEPVPYGKPFTVTFLNRVRELLNERYKPHSFKSRSLVQVRERCLICRGRRRVTLRTYETYFLHIQHKRLKDEIDSRLE